LSPGFEHMLHQMPNRAERPQNPQQPNQPQGAPHPHKIQRGDTGQQVDPAPAHEPELVFGLAEPDNKVIQKNHTNHIVGDTQDSGHLRRQFPERIGNQRDQHINRQHDDEQVEKTQLFGFRAVVSVNRWVIHSQLACGFYFPLTPAREWCFDAAAGTTRPGPKTKPGFRQLTKKA
jgi:hypothetical protein